MKRFLALIGSGVGGTIGWWLGARVGLTTAVFVGAVGSAAGLYFTARLVREYLP